MGQLNSAPTTPRAQTPRIAEAEPVRWVTEVAMLPEKTPEAPIPQDDPKRPTTRDTYAAFTIYSNWDTHPVPVSKPATSNAVEWPMYSIGESCSFKRSVRTQHVESMIETLARRDQTDGRRIPKHCRAVAVPLGFGFHSEEDPWVRGSEYYYGAGYKCGNLVYTLTQMRNMFPAATN
jgi:hypothetical protein